MLVDSEVLEVEILVEVDSLVEEVDKEVLVLSEVDDEVDTEVL